MRKAGESLIAFAQTPMGEEVLEGILGGTLAGTPGFFQSDKDPGETTLQLAGAIAGGIGLGMAGRKIGARLGRRIHPGEIKDPTIAALARATGQETIADAMEQIGKQTKAGVGEYITQRYQRGLQEDLATMDHATFFAKHPGLGKVAQSKDEVMKLLQELDGEKGLHQAMAVMNSIDPDAAFKQLQDMAKDPAFAASAPELRKAMAEGNVESLDQILRDTAERMKGDPDIADSPMLKVLGLSPEKIEAMQGAAAPVTGEHAGRGIGRFLGDEAGVLLGYGGGTMLAGALGMQSPKDREIARLQQELSAR